MLKTCSACKRSLEANQDNFNVDITKKDGFYNQCRECYQARRRITRELIRRRSIVSKYLKAVKSGHMDPNKRYNWLNVSGGKDSTAMILWALKYKLPNCRFIYADTGHEHSSVGEYLKYLQDKLGILITTVSNESFIDIVLKKGGFPAAAFRYCTYELKMLPIAYHMYSIEYNDEFHPHNIFVGVRAQESRKRALLPRELEQKVTAPPDFRSFQKRHHPILEYSHEDVFRLHKEFGVEPNPLYLQGFNRVGCFPCIFAKKNRINISK